MSEPSADPHGRARTAACAIRDIYRHVRALAATLTGSDAVADRFIPSALPRPAHRSSMRADHYSLGLNGARVHP
jgi:hypothetical protein